MTYTIKQLAKAIESLRSIGFDGVVIGSTVLHLALKSGELEDDIDLFVTSCSPFMEEDRLRAEASRRGWSVGYTELGTPAVSMNIDGRDIRVELYENIYDFYIPEEVLKICTRRITVEGTPVHHLALDCWVVLKARRGSEGDMEALLTIKRLISRRVLRLDTSLMKRVLELYGEDKNFILSRLKGVGLAP
ncbi:MAG: nucleotidyltransferase [Thermoprotei archaeon]|nr:MAG: nucleotidyltransferase [Thermoprotei archaeon]